jgi:hypothetical protein
MAILEQSIMYLIILNESIQMLTYSQLRAVMAQEYSTYSNRYNINIKIGRSNPNVKNYIFAGQLYKILSGQSGDDTVDNLTKEEIQLLIKLFNKITVSTIQIDYEA